MIRATLTVTKAATFCVQLPNANQHGMPSPVGSGFFISPDGWFVTAAHVVTVNNKPDGLIRDDLTQAWLKKETREAGGLPGAMCQAISFHQVIPHLDFALLKVDFNANANKAWLSGKNEFPYLTVSRRQLEEGESVYSFGYPLSEALSRDFGSMKLGVESLCPRVTSAIISSTIDRTKMLMTDGDPKIYVLDKALNYGNSGGPIVAVETGKVNALCSRFQPVYIPQDHIHDATGKPIYISIPSLYGVVSSLGNIEILSLLELNNIPISDD